MGSLYCYKHIDLTSSVQYCYLVVLTICSPCYECYNVCFCLCVGVALLVISKEKRCEWMLNYLLPVVRLTTTETEDIIMVSVQSRQVGCPLIFISVWLKAKIWGSNLYLQSLYTWPLASSLSPWIHSQHHHFLFSHQILLYYFLSFLQSAISLRWLFRVCFFLLLYFLTSPLK